MFEFEVSFAGSAIMCTSFDALPSFSELMRQRLVRVSFDPLPRNLLPRCLVSRRNKLVHPAWDEKLIARFLRSICVHRRNAVDKKVDELMKPFEIEERLYELLKAHQNADDPTLSRFSIFGDNPGNVKHKRIQKKKKLIHRCAKTAAVMNHMILENDSITKMSKKLNIPLHRVRKISKLIKSTEGEVLRAELLRVKEEEEKEDVLRQALLAHRKDTPFLELTVTQARAIIAQELPEGMAPSRRKYFETLKKEGFRFRTLKHKPRLARPLSTEQKLNFLLFFRQMIFEEDRFHVLFLDESSIVPENFRKRRWFARGETNQVETRVKYEKLMFIAAMSTSEVSAVQLLGSGFNGALFVAFIHSLLEGLRIRSADSRQIVLVMDNSTCHHSRLLAPVLSQFGVIAFFNAPHHSHLNAIEFLWEHAKRPLRRMTDYPS